MTTEQRSPLAAFSQGTRLTRISRDTAGGADDPNLVALSEVCRLHGDLSHADAVEPVADTPAIDFAAGGVGAVDFAPLPQIGALIITVPEAPVEDLGKLFLQRRRKGGGKSPVRDRVGGPAVAGCAALHVVGAAGPSFNLQHPHAAVDHTRQELNGTQVLRRHYIFIVYIYLRFSIKS